MAPSPNWSSRRPTAVSARRKFGRFCSLKVRPLRCWSLCRVLGSGGWQRVDAAVLESVGAAFEGEDVGVVDDPVDHRGGDDLVAEHVAPAGEGQVAGEDERGVFVADADELEEQVRGVLLEGDVADLVDDDEAVAA